MSQAIHVYTDHRLLEWFECPECGAREPVTSHVWQTVEVLGHKPTLDCYHHPHIPPSPAALREHEDAHALATLLVALSEVVPLSRDRSLAARLQSVPDQQDGHGNQHSA